MTSLLDPSVCGFVRAAFHIVNNHKPLLPKKEQPGESLEARLEREKETDLIRKQPLRERLDEIRRYYPTVCLDHKQFSKLAPKFKDKCKSWTKDNAGSKKRYFDFFSPEKWIKMSSDAKDKHSYVNCQACLHDHKDIQSLFPQRKMDKPLRTIQPNIDFSQDLPQKQATLDFYDNANTVYKQTYGMTLAQGLVEIPELKLQHAKSNREQKIEEKKLVRKVARQIQEHSKATAMER